MVKEYDRHVAALSRAGAPATIQQEALHGLDLVDRMESVFLGK